MCNWVFGLSDVGIVLDMAGAFILSRGLIFMRLSDSLRLERGVYGTHAEKLASTRAQIHEARAGLITLILGFMAQLVGNHVKEPIPTSVFSVIAVSSVVFCLLFPKVASRLSTKEVSTLSSS
jgi:hypothetical protein